MKTTKKIVLTVIVGVVSIMVSAQQTVSVNGNTFKSELEVAEASVSSESIMLKLYEINKFNPKYEMDNCTDCPDGKSLVMDIAFNRGFKFPIKETDSVFIRTSAKEQGIAEYEHDTQQIEKMSASVHPQDAVQLKNNSEIIKAKGMEIAKLMQEGKLSPQEAEKRLLELTKPLTEELDNSGVTGIETTEYAKKATYSFSFYNDETLTETEPFSGYLWIKEFNQNRFMAEFRGNLIEKCVEKRSAKSLEEEKKCSAKTSQYLPEAKVLSEGQGSVSIDISIKAFLIIEIRNNIFVAGDC